MRWHSLLAFRESLPVVPRPLFASAAAEESASGCLLARVPTLPACTGMFGTKEALLHAVQYAWNNPVRWGWTNAAEIEYESRKDLRRPSHYDEQPKHEALAMQLDKSKKQVVPPEPLPVSGKDELLIMRVMDGKVTDWTRARRAAEQIRSPSYTTKDFYSDLVAAFPELRLYCVVREAAPHGEGRVLLPSISTLTTSASRTGEDEYQRTIGALFCIFWLMRTHLDGKESFCFGLDTDWKPRNRSHFQEPELEVEYKKRKNFYEKTDWAAIEGLFVGAGLLKKAGGPHDVERTLAMLVLMTVHDVMKLDILRPIVGVGEFAGYKNGEPIGDHDVALSYVLERCPQALPSFAGLSTEMQESIKFTHCKLDYNMGWLVQAEAPPGALFKAFRKVVLAGAASDQKSASNIAFYFVHWFADLAGAEASPLQGCEKFVLKFPQQVLGSFIDSFAVGSDRSWTKCHQLVPTCCTMSPFSTSSKMLDGPGLPGLPWASAGDKFKFGTRKSLGLALASVAALTAATASESEAKSVKADDRSHELSGDEQRTVALFERCSGSVVHISTFVQDKSLLRGAFGMANVDMQDIPQGTGSGFMWDSKHIVTNYHVIKDADKAMIVFADHTSREAFLVGHEPDFDLAVLRFEKPDELEIKALDRGSSCRLQVGQKVFAIGNPFGLDQTLTSGIVSGLGGISGRMLRGLVQTDAAINPGNSGGPLLDARGRLIGVNTMIASPSGAFAGVGFAIPVDTVTRIVDQIIKYGFAKQPYLGLYMAQDHVKQQLSRLLYRQRMRPIEGALIMALEPEGPADQAGLRPSIQTMRGIQLGDEILSIDGKKVSNLDDIFEALDQREIGETVKVVYRRRSDGHEKDSSTSLRLAERPLRPRNISSRSPSDDGGVLVTEHVWNLGPKTETEVFEEYLVWRWGNMEQRLGPAPTGSGAIAKMRLVLMAQGDNQEVLRQFSRLKKADQQVLSQELAITGCLNQKFKRDSYKDAGGPAILVYYAPALMQKAGKQDPAGALIVMAEIFRQARSLWPLSKNQEDCDKTILVRIDVLKEMQVSAILEPRPDINYVLCRVSSQDAQVKIVSNLDMKEIDKAS
ncbi:DEGP1 [Symbiodinium sp. CCMP2592]|nr:DEGP1 [Symbiodinium sp. CCMP2592]